MKSIFLMIFSILSLSTFAQELSGKKVRVKVHSEALDGNLLGDSPDRDVSIYTPPSYEIDANKKYPVLYMLHGFNDSDSQWMGWEEHWINLIDILEKQMNNGNCKEMIVVMPNAKNALKGSMYSSSVTIGDWETFITKELINYVDANYRTIANKDSRGLAGHSMGGYGTIRLSMKFPDIWSSIYLLSPCCMDRTNPITDKGFMERLEQIDNFEKFNNSGFFECATIASAAAWAPNPENPPFYLDFPFQNVEVDEDINNKLESNRILNMIDQYIHNIKKLNAIAMDAGTFDFTITSTTKELHEVLDNYNIEHQYESYPGDHINKIAQRIETKVLPFFSEHLIFE